MEDHLEILEWTLRVRHISPTAPDTLGICLATPVGPRGRDGFPAQPRIQKSCFGSDTPVLILSVAQAYAVQTRASSPSSTEHFGHSGVLLALSEKGGAPY